jgi:hypothetical protein
MPGTVRCLTLVRQPSVSAQKVSKLGAVKHGRNRESSEASEVGT